MVCCEASAGTPRRSTSARTASFSSARISFALRSKDTFSYGCFGTIYFLFAYHYALLQLSRYSDCHYPGLTVLDFFADIARTDSIGERLGLVLEPFIELEQQVEIPLQLIAAARDFPRRTDIQFIELNQTWV